MSNWAAKVLADTARVFQKTSTRCYIYSEMKPDMKSRAFKTAWFAKASKKERITDAQLCAAIRQVMAGQADDLGGGVFKRRLNDNMHRSIILAQGGRSWVYAYLFAKKDRSNIDETELSAFKSWRPPLAG